MAKITRIKATDGPKEPEENMPEFSDREARALKKAAEKERKSVKKAERRKERIEDREAQGGKKSVGHALTAPFRYLRDSWREIRQVRWPNRKTTWKMVLAIFIYAALFVALIMLLDVFFTWLFNLILK